MGFRHVGQARLKLLSSVDIPTLAYQSAGTAGISHHTWPIYLLILRQVLTLSPRLDCSGTIMPHSSLDFLVSSNPIASASQSVKITNVSHVTRPGRRHFSNSRIFMEKYTVSSNFFFFLMEFCSCCQAGGQWHYLGSLQRPLPMSKRFSCLCVISKIFSAAKEVVFEYKFPWQGSLLV